MPKFTRLKEDFTCEHCGALVQGNGYTNHCLDCLWSKHVDINPGDRANECGGLMEPIGAKPYGRGWRVIHCCQKCGFKKENKIWPDDNFDELIKISKKQGKNL